VGDEATCTKNPASSTCISTPAENAGNLAQAFSTVLHYGHSVSAVKVMQSLALGAANAEAAAPDTSLAESFKLDTELHMLMPFMQALIHMASNVVSPGATPPLNNPEFVKMSAFMSLSLLHETLRATAPDAADAAYMMLHPLNTNTNPDTYCAVKSLVENNLPNASTLQYTMGHLDGASSTPPTPMATENGAIVHLGLEDLGALSTGPSCANYAFTPPSAGGGMANLLQVTRVFSAAHPASTFNAAWTSAIRIKTALHLSVSTDRVSITTAGDGASTEITVTVGYTSRDAADAGVTLLTQVAGSATNAAAFLSTPTQSITIIQETNTAQLGGSTAAQTAATEGLQTGELIGIIVGCGVAALLIIVFLIFVCQKKQEGKPIFTCLDETKEVKAVPAVSQTSADSKI